MNDKIRTLTVDDELVSREKMKKIMSSYGECKVVERGSAAIETFRNALLNNDPFDLVTIDISMPDMDGTEVLYTLREIEVEFSVPVENRAKTIMVTSRSDKDTIITCIQAGCDNYIVKPFDKNIISSKLHRIGFSVGSEENEEQITIRNLVMKTVKSFNEGKIELPVLPHVVKDILEEMKNPKSGIEEIAKIIEKDAVISLRLIATANSPAYRGSEKVHSVISAIPRLGLKETQDIVTAIASKSMYDTKNKHCKVLMEKLWIHSLSCAYCTKVISEKINYPEKEKLFMMGLLHDIGKVLLLKTIGLSAGKEVVFDRKEVVDSIQAVHTNFGAALLVKWGFDREFSEIASCHEWSEFKSGTMKEILIINLANILVRYMGYTIFDTDEINLSDINSAKYLGINEEQVNDIVTKTKDIICKSVGDSF